MDVMVLKTQQWLNYTYRSDNRYTSITEDGYTGWETINALIIALQIELGMPETAAVIGPTTRGNFNAKYPNGIVEQTEDDTKTDKVHSIIQGALWCKGYYAEIGNITEYYKGQTAASIRALKSDMGIGGTSTVTMEIMECLLSMKQFVLLSNYGGKTAIRAIQQQINREYRNYTGIIPCDGIYGREMNTAIIQVLQAIEGFEPEVSNGNFGNGTKGALKEISRLNALENGKWVWIASVALVCNGYLDSPVVSWTDGFAIALRIFQTEYALPLTDKLDVNTWMSLFVSKGNTDRAAVACDTRFEVTDALAAKLKADEYQIVGRYLTGGDFKEIRDGELERILGHGLKYFPIFQENGRNLSEFTYETGKLHAKQAREAAIRHGVPSTVIYFAVDLDVMDYQVDSNILPYFKGVSENMGPLFKVGIYASRNVCTRIAEAGYTVSSFVSDMSTGYSGNLGFPIPDNWNYDQFHEISGYGGSWDLDKVAYKGRILPCDTVKNYTSTTYTPPANPDTTNVPHTIFEVIDLIRELEDVYLEYRDGKYLNYVPSGYDYSTKELYEGVLNYLSIYYLTDVEFALAVQRLDEYFVEFMETEHINLVNRLNAYIGDPREDVKDNIGGLNDVAHVALSTLAYVVASPAPDYWASWGGDLASGMAYLHEKMTDNPTIALQVKANSVIGSTEGGCNYTDLCDDGDSIGISQLIKSRAASPHVLSEAMQDYYSNISTIKRYLQYEVDGLDFSSEYNMYTAVTGKMCGILESVGPFAALKGDATPEEEDAACRAFASYLYSRMY